MKYKKFLAGSFLATGLALAAQEERKDSYRVLPNQLENVVYCNDFSNVARSFSRESESIEYKILGFNEISGLGGTLESYVEDEDKKRIKSEVNVDKERIERDYMGKPLAVVGIPERIRVVDEYSFQARGEKFDQYSHEFLAIVELKDIGSDNRLSCKIKFTNSDKRDQFSKELIDLMERRKEVVAYGTLAKKVESKKDEANNQKGVLWYTELEFHGVKTYTE